MKDSVKTVNLAPVNKEMDALLKHFKSNNGFPIIIDSAYMANISKHDSLGTNEVRMLAQKWYDDSLVGDHAFALKDFYTIDSAKAKCAYDKWASKLDIGMTALSNAYALRKIDLTDGTEILEWSLELISYPACPSFDNTQINFTIFNKNTIGPTFILGSSLYGADAPMVGQTIITGKLTANGNLSLDEKSLEEDMDTTVANLNHTHYDYILKQESISRITKKRDATKEIKVKAGQ